MSRGRGYFAEIRFCPKCGCERLQRDSYRIDNKINETTYPEFICNLCGFGFLIKPSLRWEHALGLFKRDRRLRPSNDKREITLAGDSSNKTNHISASELPEQMDQTESSELYGQPTSGNRDGDNEEISGGPAREGFPRSSSQGLVGTSPSSTSVRGEDKKRTYDRDFLRRLLGPSRKWIIFY